MVEESFEELLESYDKDRSASLRVGEKVRAKIIQIGRENVFLDVGAKLDAVTARQELVDAEGELALQVGDAVELYVVGVDGSEIRLSRALGGEGGLEQLEQAYANALPVQGKVQATRKGGYDVTVFGRRAFCPLSQMDAVYVEDPESHVGLEDSFLVTKLEEGGRNIVLSRRALLEREQKEALAGFLTDISAGDVLQGTVTRLAPYGAFVELAPHVEGMVHISELSWARTDTPEDVVTPGDRVTVKILRVGRKAGGQVKIDLSMKQASPDPWETVADRFSPGEIVTGRVTNLAPFGAFVEIAPGIEGLVHVSEMSFAKRVHKPEDMVSRGEEVSVKILSIDQEGSKLSLSLREAEGDPWAGAPEKYPRGKVVTGTVERVEGFGVFVGLEPGITGLLPKSLLERSPEKGKLSNLKPGDQVAVLVQDIRPQERKMTLGPTDLTDTEDWGSFAQQDSGSFGSLGESLDAALKARKKG